MAPRHTWARFGPLLVLPIAVVILIALSEVAGQLGLVVAFVIALVVCVVLVASIQRARR
jgi:hypothetical protein